MPLTAPLRIGTADPADFSRTFSVVEATSAQVDDTGSSRDFHLEKRKRCLNGFDSSVSGQGSGSNLKAPVETKGVSKPERCEHASSNFCCSSLRRLSKPFPQRFDRKGRDVQSFSMGGSIAVRISSKSLMECKVRQMPTMDSTSDSETYSSKLRMSASMRGGILYGSCPTASAKVSSTLSECCDQAWASFFDCSTRYKIR